MNNLTNYFTSYMAYMTTQDRAVISLAAITLALLIAWPLLRKVATWLGILRFFEPAFVAICLIAYGAIVAVSTGWIQ